MTDCSMVVGSELSINPKEKVLRNRGVMGMYIGRIRMERLIKRVWQWKGFQKKMLVLGKRRS